MQSTYTSFQSNGKKLQGLINHCSEPKAQFIIFFVGISGKATLTKFDYLAQIANKAGYHFFRFEYSRENEGDINDCSLEKELNDCEKAIKHLKTLGYNLDEYGIITKSFGATKAFLMQNTNIKFLIGLAPAIYFNEKANVNKLLKKRYSQIKTIQEIYFDINILNKINYPVLLFHGDKDEVVSLSNSENIINQIGKKSMLKIINGAGHSFSSYEGQLAMYIKGFLNII